MRRKILKSSGTSEPPDMAIGSPCCKQGRAALANLDWGCKDGLAIPIFGRHNRLMAMPAPHRKVPSSATLSVEWLASAHLVPYEQAVAVMAARVGAIVLVQ